MQAAFGLRRKKKGSPIARTDRMLGSTPEIEEPDLKENMLQLPGSANHPGPDHCPIPPVRMP